MSNNEARRETVEVAAITVIAAFLISFGAILVSTSLGFAFGALPTIIERANSNSTSGDDVIAGVYNALSEAALQYSIVGTGLMIGGLVFGLGSLYAIKRKIPK